MAAAPSSPVIHRSVAFDLSGGDDDEGEDDAGVGHHAAGDASRHIHDVDKGGAATESERKVKIVSYEVPRSFNNFISSHVKSCH